MSSPFQFDVWKSQLRNNCEREDKLSAFNSFDDIVLRLFFMRGVEPTPEAIVEDAERGT